MRFAAIVMAIVTGSAGAATIAAAHDPVCDARGFMCNG